MLSRVIGPVVRCLVPAEVREPDSLGQVAADFAEGPLGQVLGRRGFVGDEHAGVPFQDELQILPVILPDRKAVVEAVVDAFDHDLLQEPEVHHHSLLAVAALLYDGAFDGGDDDAPVAVELVAERKVVRQGMAVVDLDLA